MADETPGRAPEEAIASLGDPLGLTGAIVDIGGRAYSVRPPMLKEVLQANAALAAAAAGLDDADALLREALRAWLPLSARSTLLSPAVRRADRFQCIETCLKVGIDSEAAEEDEKETQQQARKAGWNEIIAEYRQRYRPQDVLAEPWPFFCRQVAQMTRLKALYQTEQAEWYGAARLGGEHLRRMYKEAGLYETPEPPPHLVGEAGEAWAKEKKRERMAYLERRRAKLKAEAEARAN